MVPEGALSPQQADSVGAYLRRLREDKGSSLDDIARATRVGRRHLEALEANEAHELPAPVFVKGFIRAYCEFLETPPDEALTRYRRHAGESTPAPRPRSIGRARPSRLGSPVAVSLLLLAVLGGALVAVNLGLRSSGPGTTGPRPSGAPVTPEHTAPGGAARAPAPASPDASPRAEPGAVQTSASEAAAPVPAPIAKVGRQRLAVRAVESTWVRVQADGATAVEELLPAGAVREWISEGHFVLTLGNAGGVELTLNGERLPPLGDRGAVIREMVLPQAAAAAPRS